MYGLDAGDRGSESQRSKHGDICMLLSLRSSVPGSLTQSLHLIISFLSYRSDKGAFCCLDALLCSLPLFKAVRESYLCHQIRQHSENNPRKTRKKKECGYFPSLLEYLWLKEGEQLDSLSTSFIALSFSGNIRDCV